MAENVACETDAFAQLRAQLGTLAAMSGEFAGIPVAIDGEELVVEPRYPFANFFNRRRQDDRAEPRKVRNRFWSSHLHSEAVVFERDGRIDIGIVPGIHNLTQQLSTLGCSVAWGLEQETKAQELLATLIAPHAWKKYMLTGMFLETSRRSGLTYVFRRLRPTVALTTRGSEVRILAALCMHPIAYYAGSWAGAMCPTDDVVAHLMLMRGDEHGFWKRCNQHAPYRPEAGL